MSCPDCFNGAIHEGNPTGTVTKLHGLDTYVAEPASGKPPKGVVVIIPDAFGWDFVNIRLMADHMARKRDYRVYAPDFMMGNSAPLWLLDSVKTTESSTASWLSKKVSMFWMLVGMVKFIVPNRFGVSYPIVRDWLSSLRKAEAAQLPVGAAGYCWGGKHVALLGANKDKADDGKPLVDALFTAHPSLLSFYGDIEPIKLPVSFAVAEFDNQMSMEQAAETKRIIEAKPADQRGELIVFKGCGHGFGCRTDVRNEDGFENADRAENQALEWFDKHFEGIKY